MPSAEPDRPDTGDDSDSDAGTSANPETDPAGALDEMEERMLDDELRPAPRVDERTDDGTGSAFEVDMDPDDQGRHDAGAESSG